MYEIYVIENLPDTGLNGVEIESTWIVSPNFSVRGYYARQSSSLGELFAADPVNPNQQFEEVSYIDPITGAQRSGFLGQQYALEGNELPNMPKNKWSLTGDWRRSMDERGMLTWKCDLLVHWRTLSIGFSISPTTDLTLMVASM